MTITREEHIANIERSKVVGTAIISLDTIFLRGIPRGLCFDDEVFGHSEGIRVYPLIGTEYIHIIPVADHGKQYLAHAFFLQSGTDTSCSPFSYDLTSVIDPIIKQGIVRATDLDPIVSRRYCEENSCDKFESDSARLFRTRMIARDRSMPVFASEGVIRQANKVIGNYEIASIQNGAGSPGSHSIVKVSYLDGGACARVEYGTNYMNDLILVYTVKDQLERTIQMWPDQKNKEHSFAEYLVKEGYL